MSQGLSQRRDLLPDEEREVAHAGTDRSSRRGRQGHRINPAGTRRVGPADRVLPRIRGPGSAAGYGCAGTLRERSGHRHRRRARLSGAAGRRLPRGQGARRRGRQRGQGPFLARPAGYGPGLVPPRPSGQVRQAIREFAGGWLTHYVAFMAKSDIVKQDAKGPARRTRHETTPDRRKRRPGPRARTVRPVPADGGADRLLARDARRVEDLVVVVDDERFGEHCLVRAGEPPLGAPGQVILVIAPLGPLREARDVVGVVLVAQDPDGLAAFVLQALAQDLQEELLDIVPATGPGVKLGYDMGAHDQVPPDWDGR